MEKASVLCYFAVEQGQLCYSTLFHEVAASFIADSTSYSRTAPRLVGKNR